MAGRAGVLSEVEAHQLCARHGFVTFVARHRRVRPGQRKARLSVGRKAVTGVFECRPSVAFLAAVEPRRPRELTLVLILMAVHAAREFNLEPGCSTRGNVALRALDGFVRRVQWESSLGMVGNRKC
jgi:hypothetical protein